MQSTMYKAPKSKLGNDTRRKKNISIITLIIIFCIILFIMYLIFPKETQNRAVKTVGGEITNNAVGKDSYYDPLIISEVMSVNDSAVPDEKGNFSDYIEIYNSGDTPINLRGVGLSDRSDRIKFLFPECTLNPKGFVVVFASNRSYIDTNLNIFHAKFKLTSMGEKIYLFDPNAYIINSVSCPIMASNEAYMLQGDGKYHLSTQYSPGYDNTEQGYLEYRSGIASSEGIIIINEICPDPKTGLRDESDELQDWIELYNNSDSKVSLANFALSDNEGKPLKWRFPHDAYIEPHSYYVVFSSGKDIQRPTFPHTNFKISAENETIVLSDSKGRLIDRVTIDNIPEDSSYALTSSGQWEITNVTTPGSPNNQEGKLYNEKLLLKYNPTKVQISEVMASNDQYQLGPNLISSDYIELYNLGTKPINLSGFGLSDSLSRPRRWQFPNKTTINPKSYLLIILDGDTSKTNENELHANFKLSKAGGETVVFSDSQGRILDKMSLPYIPTNISYGRKLESGGFFYFRKATPLAKNEESFTGYTNPPQFSLDSGHYKGNISVSLSCNEGEKIYYTLDGSIPTESSLEYTAPINIDTTTVVRARTFGLNLEPSDVVTKDYLMNMYHTLPVVCIAVNPDELFNPQNGMFTPGENIDKSKGIPFKNSIYREYGKIERPGNIQIFNTDNTILVSQDMEFGLQGQYSLDMPQKTLKVRSKSKYNSKYFNAKLFDDREFTQYKTFVLRNSGNDCVWTRLADALQHRLVEKLDTTVIRQAWKPVVVYINGKYWGHYNMRERADRFFIAQHEGLPLDQADNMNVVEANRKTYFGSNAEFTELKKIAETLNTRDNPEDLKYLTDRIDVINYFDYLAIEIFFGNSDPGNTRCYKLNKEGSKWRWVLFDLDYGLFNSKFDSPKSYLKPEGSGEQKIPNILIRKLLENKEMEDLFLKRLAIVYKTFTTETMLNELDYMVSIIEPEMNFHFNRWAEFNDKAINFDSPTTPEGAMTYWKSRISRLKNIIMKRPNLLYDMIQTQFNLSSQQMLDYFGEKPAIPAEAI